MPQKINTFDKTTPLSELRDVLGWDENPLENAVSLVMILCQRVEALQTRVEELEQKKIPCLDLILSVSKRVEKLEAATAQDDLVSEMSPGQLSEDWLTENLPPTTAPFNPRPGAEYGVQV